MKYTALIFGSLLPLSMRHLLEMTLNRPSVAGFYVEQEMVLEKIIGESMLDRDSRF